MDKSEALKMAKQYARAVSRHYDVKKVIMFGSYVKGTNREDSDIDLAIVLNSGRNLFDIQTELMKLRTDDALFIEPHPFYLPDFSPSDPVVSEIIKTGIEIQDYVA